MIIFSFALLLCPKSAWRVGGRVATPRRGPRAVERRASAPTPPDDVLTKKTAVFLLRLGTAMYPVGDAAVALTQDARAQQGMALYAAVILSFIGGMQQGVATREGAGPTLVASGIGVAIGAFLCSVVALFAPAGACGALAALFALQALLEGFAAPWKRLSPEGRSALLCDERRVPMLLAVATLFLATVLL